MLSVTQVMQQIAHNMFADLFGHTDQIEIKEELTNIIVGAITFDQVVELRNMCVKNKFETEARFPSKFKVTKQIGNYGWRYRINNFDTVIDISYDKTFSVLVGKPMFAISLHTRDPKFATWFKLAYCSVR